MKLVTYAISHCCHKPLLDILKQKSSEAVIDY